MDSVSMTLAEFAKDYCEYLPPEVPELDHVPSIPEFLYEYVSTSLPFLMKCKDPSVVNEYVYENWKDNEFLYYREYEEGVKDKSIFFNLKPMTVAVTPNGLADAIYEGKFMLPEERKMTLVQILAQLRNHTQSGVFYVQTQNNNLATEFDLLCRDVRDHVPWANEAFMRHPEASNIWIGNSDSVTSMHKDHYENLYYVITGSKKFTLYPPISAMWMPYKKYRKFQWEWTKGHIDEYHWTKKDLNEEIYWISPDLQPETPQKRLMAQNTKSYVVNVHPGETLYIPALWYHQVEQSDRTIALNYWYDMKYDMRYPYYCLLDRLSKLPGPRADASTLVESDFDSSYEKDAMIQEREAKMPKGLLFENKKYKDLFKKY